MIRRIRGADGHPGVLDRIGESEFHLFGVHREDTLRGAPGEIVAQRHGAIWRATVDGAVWIGHLKRPDHFELPATRALELAGHGLDVAELPAARAAVCAADVPRDRVRGAVLMGGLDFFSNGIHLNVIEAAEDPAAESWSNLVAIDDVVRE